MPLAQIHHLIGLHPFGRKAFVAAGSTVFSFAVVPGVVRILLGSGLTSLVTAAIAGLVVYALLLKRFHAILRLDLLLGRLRGSMGGRSSASAEVAPAMGPSPIAVASGPGVPATPATAPPVAVAPASTRGARRRIGRHRWSD